MERNNGVGRLKKCLLRTAAGCGAVGLARWATRKSFRVFAYHGVTASIEPQLNFDGFFAAPDVFETHLRTLKHHYHVMPLSQIVRDTMEGNVLPPNAAAITFDDGYLNNFEEAAPLLAKYDLPATFFVTTGFVDGTCEAWWWRIRDSGYGIRDTGYSCGGGIRDAGYVDWCVDVERKLKNMSAPEREKQLADMFSRIPDHESRIPSFMSYSHLRELAAQGHEIGAHTVSHISLGHESLETIEAEVAGSLARLKEEVGAVSPVYSYPYGEAAHFTSALASMLKHHGCIGGVTTLEGLNCPGTDPFFIRRFNITGNHDRYAFRALASGLMACLLS